MQIYFSNSKIKMVSSTTKVSVIGVFTIVLIILFIIAVVRFKRKNDDAPIKNYKAKMGYLVSSFLLSIPFFVYVVAKESSSILFQPFSLAVIWIICFLVPSILCLKNTNDKALKNIFIAYILMPWFLSFFVLFWPTENKRRLTKNYLDGLFLDPRKSQDDFMKDCKSLFQDKTYDDFDWENIFGDITKQGEYGTKSETGFLYNILYNPRGGGEKSGRISEDHKTKLCDALYGEKKKKNE